MSLEDVIAYDKETIINKIDIMLLTFRGISLEEAEKYYHRFNGTDLIHLANAGCSFESAAKYPQRFQAIDVIALLNGNISPEIAKIYRSEYDGIDISILEILRVKNREMTNEEEKKLLNAYKNWYQKQMKKIPFCLFNLLGVGVSGCVVITKSSKFPEETYKFSIDINYEYKLLQKNQEFHKGEQTHTLKIYELLEDGFGARIEFIRGNSLCNLLEKKSYLSMDKTLKYSYQILLGLQELRQAGIYHHRDLRPANIMIDEEHDRAVIIDLGIATTEQEFFPKDNRRYGGPNDLISLGQIMYKMATGKHLFAKSKSMERTVYAEELKDHRDWIYEKPERLKRYLGKVNRNVGDERISSLINFCLQAKGTDEDYKILEEMLNQRH